MAKEKLRETSSTLCVLKNGEFFLSDERGIKPLLSLLNENNRCFESAVIADKVIGKAAALLMVFGGAKKVYTAVISKPALEVFSDNAVSVEYDALVERIENRSHTGLCPMEERAMSVSSPAEAFKIFSSDAV